MRKLKFKAWFPIPKIMSDPFGVGYPIDDWVTEEKSKGRIDRQYTGLNDKNSVEIYEGDIVIFENNILTCSPLINIEFRKSIGKMAWDDKACSYRVFDSVGKYYVWCNELIESMEVIGNVHEHSELLDPKEEPTK